MSYIDTSVLVAYYVPEVGSDAVQRTLSRLRRSVISPLVEVELLSALSRKVRTDELDITEASKAASLFDLHLADQLFQIVPVAAREYRIAHEWIRQFDTPLRTLDALHLAATFCNDLTLLTADESLAQCAKHLGVKAKLI